MTAIVLGFLLIIAGFFSIQFPELVTSLKTNDKAQWKLLGSPPVYAFSKMIGIFSWVLSQAYKKSPSSEVVELGHKAFKKAQFIKYTLLAGVILLIFGSAILLITSVQKII